MRQIKNDTLLRQIAFRLKELRELKGVSQRDVLMDTEIHIGRIEQGKLNVTVSTLEELCKYFNVSLVEFFSGLK